MTRLADLLGSRRITGIDADDGKGTLTLTTDDGAAFNPARVVVDYQAPAPGPVRLELTQT